MAQRQLNIRLADDDVAVLEAAAFADGGAVPDLVRAILLERIGTLRRDPDVAELLRVRADRARRQAEADAGVSSLVERRRTRGPDDPA